MLVTLTNSSGRDLNVPAVGEDGLSLPGGNHPNEATHRTDPLPYPFGHIGIFGSADPPVVLPMHPRDWHYSRSQMQSMPVSEQWQQLIQAGTVTLATGAQADSQDQEELYIHEV